MRKSLRRWLLHRRQPQVKPLYQRTSWYDFAGRMHRTLDLDIRFDLGEITRSEWRDQKKTKPLPAVDPNAPTEAAHLHWSCADETIAEVGIEIDQYATQPMELVKV